MAKWFDDIRNIVNEAKDENEARINLYKYGMDHGYCKTGEDAHERYLTNCLEQPLDEIANNPNILYTRDSCKHDYQEKHPLKEDIISEDGEKLLNFEEWCNHYSKFEKPTFYDACMYVSSTLGSKIFDTFLQYAHRNDKPKFEKIEDPNFISGHVEQFVKENEWRLSLGEKRVLRCLKELCEKFDIEMPNLGLEEDSPDFLWSPLEFSSMEVCGMLVMNRKTNKSYVIKIF